MKKLEKLIIGFVFIFSIVSLALMKIPSNNEKSTIVVRIDNKETNRYELTHNNEDKLYQFNFDNQIGYLEVKNGKVRMLEMTKEICPNAICSDTGWIETAYQSIVCLPNKITVTIEGNDTDQEIDFVV